MLEIGRLCIKTAGRDATQYCVVVEIINETYVLIDGNTRRKKVNKSHIEPLDKILKIKKSATTKEVLTAFEKEGIEVKNSIDKKPKKEKKEQVKKNKQGVPKSKRISKDSKKK